LSLYCYCPYDPIGEKVNSESVCGLERREDRESSLRYEGCDVIEAPSQRIHLRKRTEITYNSVGDGIDLAQDIWEEQVQQFSSQKQDMASRETQAKKLGPPHRVKKNILNQLPVDALLIDGREPEIWLKWIITTHMSNRPKVVASFHDPEVLVTEEGVASKVTRKALEKAGYAVQYWYLKAWEYGGALDQDRLACICTLRDFQQEAENLPCPTPNGLPPRPMRKLLLPVGIPGSAWARSKPIDCEVTSTRYYPCIVKKTCEGQSVYDSNGTMPDKLRVWIQGDRGVRKAQTEELAKAKGISSTWEPSKKTTA
jgi:hypothetical protein